MHLTSNGTLAILITNIGEFLLYYCQLFYFILFQFTVKKKKRGAAGFFFGVVLGCPVLTTWEHVPVD